MKYFPFVIALLILQVRLTAQPMPADDAAISRQYPFIRPVLNFIQNDSQLDSLCSRLQQLKTTGNRKLSIVHIGDSHIQADFLTSVLRNGFQEFFGDAGRGLVFPYQLAQSNGPDDIISSSNTKWQFNRLAHPEIPIGYGISGHGIKTNNNEPSIRLSVRSGKAMFNRVKLFTDSNTVNSWSIQAENSDSAFLVNTSDGFYPEIELRNDASHFTLTALASDQSKELYGIVLENSHPGILYHSIGVNGARYDQYNNADLFWKQLPLLGADLYIVSLGTNEAQFASFAGTAFLKHVETFLDKLKQSSPRAMILVTTAPDTYKGRKFNKVLRELNHSLTAYCNKNRIPFWDLYGITGSYSSASQWARRGLMARDRVHFTPEGYRVQGTLLLHALGKVYNSYIITK